MAKRKHKNTFVPLVFLMFMVGLLSWTLQDFIKRKAGESMVLFGIAGQDMVDITLLVSFTAIILVLAFVLKRRLDWSDAVLGNRDV